MNQAFFKTLCKSFEMDTYGKRLEAALIDLGRVDRDRAWLAGKIGISVSALSQVILGKTNALTAANHEYAVEALGCNGKWLATGIGEMEYGPLAHVDTGVTATNTVAEKPLSHYVRTIGLMFDTLPDDPHVRVKVMGEITNAILDAKRSATEPPVAPAPARSPKRQAA